MEKIKQFQEELLFQKGFWKSKLTYFDLPNPNSPLEVGDKFILTGIWENPHATKFFTYQKLNANSVGQIGLGTLCRGLNQNDYARLMCDCSFDKYTLCVDAVIETEIKVNERTYLKKSYKFSIA